MQCLTRADRRVSRGYILCLLFASLTIACDRQVLAAEPEPALYDVGLSKVDITPSYPIRLSGFAARLTESVGVRQHIFARAMAIRPPGDEPVVLVTVDSIGVPLAVRDEVAHRLNAKKKLANERFAISATHSHTTPMLAGVLPTMFGMPVPADEQKRIKQYTREYTDGIERAALAALDDLKPARVSFGIGNVGFSINRRTRGGPVDHDLPVMPIAAPDGKVRGVYVSYACHCVVLSDFKVSGDWAGYAAEELEKRYPNSVALVAIGCGADSNPQSGVTGDKAQFAQQYGHEVAIEVERLLRSTLTSINGDIKCKLDTIKLALAPLPTHDEWSERAKAQGAEGYYAKVQLAHLDAGERLATEISYPILTWQFGKSLAAVFLPGEVVADYSLRLKKELDSSRLWINAYSNDTPAYIPSERVLKEGGYEGGGAMIYYGLPGHFAPGLEDKIVSTVESQLGNEFKADDKKVAGTQGSQPKSPQESLATIQVRDGLRIELVASEPMIRSPVAIDFGPDGKVWVAEMIDYGCKDGESCPPEGRVSVLEDRDGDGTFETASVFLDKIAEPMGAKLWRKGILISAAPDLLYAEDADGDGKADVVQKMLTGFDIENPQARLNMLSYGLDGWLEVGTMRGGKVKNLRGDEIDIPNHDFRFQPDTGEIDPENGRTENSRVRDDWGNWFGTDNGVLCFHYPLSDRYVRRNASLLPPPLEVYVVRGTPAQRLFPRGKIVLLPLSGPRGAATAACGIGIYRDELLGPEFAGNAFTCEPVSQLVHRMILRPKGATFTAERAADEAKSEFLSSTDNWFRPVQARTGPDGALWIVDMYRYVIEHSRWIPKPVQDELDVYAGNTMGRIYRVLPKDKQHQASPRVDKLSTRQLAAAMDSPNGTLRDTIQQMLVWKADAAAAEPLAGLARNSTRPAVRMQALCTLDLLGKLSDGQIETALADPHPGVRRQAVRLAESRLNKSPKLLDVVLKLAGDQDSFVALQVACSLGETDDSRKIAALSRLAMQHAADPYVVSALLSSVHDNELAPLLNEISQQLPAKLSPFLVNELLELAGAAGNNKTLELAINIAEADVSVRKTSRFAALNALLSGLHRNPHKGEAITKNAAKRLQKLADQCLTIAQNDEADVKTRALCIQIVGRSPQSSDEDLRTLGNFLTAAHDSQIQLAALEALADRPQPAVADVLLGPWQTFTPALRGRVLDVLLSRKQWVATLLAAIQTQSVQASEIDAPHRAQLVEYPDPELRQKAASSFSQPSTGQRAAIVERYEKALRKGDVDRGKAVFEKNCAACHQFKNIGSSVGPNIAGRQDKSNAGLLREILDPNRAVEQRFAEYVAVTNDGVVKNGVLVSETGNAITLRGQQGVETTLLRSELDSLTTSGKSLMPEGFENQISPEQMSDLLSFLAAP